MISNPFEDFTFAVTQSRKPIDCVQHTITGSVDATGESLWQMN
jgi:hypothetical protein